MIIKFFHLVLINLDVVERTYRNLNKQYDLKTIADHYGIYEHLFGFAYFVPRTMLDIKVILKKIVC